MTPLLATTSVATVVTSPIFTEPSAPTVNLSGAPCSVSASNPSFTSAANTLPGTYYVIAQADAGHDNIETIETNNTGRQQVRIVTMVSLPHDVATSDNAA